MSGAKLPIHGRNHRVGGSDPIPFPAAAAAGLTFASIYGSEFIDIPDGTTTADSFGSAPGFYTSDPAVFSVDLNPSGSSITPYYGLNIHANGFYLLGWAVQVFDKSGHRIANPETVLVSADDGGNGSVYYPSGVVLGSNAEFGYHPSWNTAISEWDVSWWKTAAIIGDTAPVPLVAQIDQSSGETLRAVAASLVIVKLSDETFGF